MKNTIREICAIFRDIFVAAGKTLKRCVKQAKPDKSDIKENFRTITFKKGTYSAAAVTAVVIIAIVVNMIAGQLPSKVMQLDISSNDIYSISAASKKILKNLDDDIQITVIAEEDNIDEKLDTFLDRYVSLSDKLSIKTIDPVLHPSALEEYDTEENTIVVSCDETGMSQSISFDDILVVDDYSYYYYGSSEVTAFDGDGQLTSAISRVTGQETKKFYCDVDHGETELSSSLTSLLKKTGIETDELNLMMDGNIPDDCDMLILNGPTTDITDDEKDVLDDYIKGGGNLTVLMDENGPDSGNLIQLLKSYKIKMAQGYIADEQRSYQGNLYAIFPEITASGSITASMSSNMVLMNNSRGFTLSDSSDEISATSIMETSSYGYAVDGEDYESGTYVIGAISSYTAESDSDDGDVVTGNLIVFGSDSLIDSNITDAYSSLDNLSLFTGTVTSVFDDVENLSIEAKSLEVQYNTSQYGGYFSLLFIFVLPVIFLIAGLVKWNKRRKA